MPVIAIAPCRKLPDYVESIRRAGGTPRLLDPAIDKADTVIAEVDGVLLTGGGDIDPRRYGESPHATFEAAEAGRDDYEFELSTRALRDDVPLLAVCRGIQVLNVAHGGTLIQDIPSEVPGALGHGLSVPPHQSYDIAHVVWIGKGTVLWKLLQEQILEDDSCAVNSRHHQAVKRVAHGFEISATAPDGVVEGIERTGARFCLGVQWHPENFWRTGEFRPLFEGFIEACGRK